MRFDRRAERRRDLSVRRTRGLVIVPEASHDFRIRDLVETMIRYARAHQRRGVELVQATFNSVTIIVSASSDLELILRDYYRAFCGHRRIKIVGPYPEEELPGLDRYSKSELADPAVWNILRPCPE